MYLASEEKLISRILAIGATFTTLFLITGSVTDPVNAPKLFVLGGMAFSLLGVFLRSAGYGYLKENKFLGLSIGLFIASALIASFASDSPFDQNVYGTYGRNTGLLTYVCLSFVLLAASSLRTVGAYGVLVVGLLISGAINVLYSGYVMAFSDPVNWENPYGALLGTFGNPNFISSFLGLFIAACSVVAVNSKSSYFKRCAAIGLGAIAFYEMFFTDSLQGFVVAIASVYFVILMRIWNLRPRFIPWGFLGLGTSIGLVSVFGVFNRGPFSEFLYQGTMAFREQYWRAALKMGLSNPFTGVGMDAYGDNYRLARDLKAHTTPGTNVVSNSAHNVVVEFFASGGILLVTAYILILVLSLVSIFKFIARTREFDPIFASLSAVWLGYHLQSLISINQIGLAVWGWLLTGAVIGYERTTKSKSVIEVEHKLSKNSRKQVKKNSIFSANLFAGIGAVLGLMISVPPLSADMAWANAAKSGNFLNVQSALNATYMHPTSSARIVQVIQILEGSKLFDQAHEYALTATTYNPSNFDSWMALYSVKNASDEEKGLALKNLRRLDPLNPEVAKLK